MMPLSGSFAFLFFLVAKTLVQYYRNDAIYNGLFIKKIVSKTCSRKQKRAYLGFRLFLATSKKDTFTYYCAASDFWCGCSMLGRGALVRTRTRVSVGVMVLVSVSEKWKVGFSRLLHHHNHHPPHPIQSELTSLHHCVSVLSTLKKPRNEKVIRYAD